MIAQQLFRRRLLARLEEIFADHDLDLGEPSSQINAGELRRWEAAMMRMLSDESRRDIARIITALVRMDTGEYGICVECGEHIGVMRLIENPTAQTCKTCDGEEPWRPEHTR